MGRSKKLRFGAVIQALRENPELTRVYIIPALLFMLDFLLRAALGVNLIDAGADMALLAVTSFVGVLIENVEQGQQNVIIAFVFFLAFLVPWIVCLWVISIRNPVLSNLLGFLDLRLIIVWFIGLSAFFFSGVLINELIRSSPSSTI